MKTPNRIYLILAVLFGVVGVVQCVRWGSVNLGMPMTGFLPNFLPATAFLTVYIVNKTTAKKVVHVIAVLLCLLWIGYWGLFTLVIEMFISAGTPVTDVGKYNAVVSRFDENLVSHFPRPIPSDAREVRFSFLPGFLQGGAHIQLRYSTSPDKIVGLYDRFSAIRTKSVFGGDKTDHINSEEKTLTTYFYRSGSSDDRFPDDYEIMILDKIPTKGEREQFGYWNHGQCHGVAISKKRNEIVYWAEEW